MSINDREFGYTHYSNINQTKKRLFCCVEHIIVAKIANLNSRRTVPKKITSHFAKVQLSEEVGQGSDQNTIQYLIQPTTVKHGLI